MTIARAKAESAFVDVLVTIDASDAIDANTVKAAESVHAPTREYGIAAFLVKSSGFHALVDVLVALLPFPSYSGNGFLLIFHCSR